MSLSPRVVLLQFPVIARIGLCNLAARSDAAREPNIAPNCRSPSDDDAAENRCAGVNEDIVLDNWMPGGAFDKSAVLIGGKVARAKRHRLIDPYALAYDRGSANNNAGAVIDEETRADLRAWMNIDPGPRMSDFRDETRQ